MEPAKVKPLDIDNMIFGSAEYGAEMRCDVCPFTATTFDALEQHLNSHEPLSFDDSQNTYSCDLCYFKTAFPQRFATHKASHMSEGAVKRFECKDCNFETIDEGDFEKHRKTHEAKKGKGQSKKTHQGPESIQPECSTSQRPEDDYMVEKYRCTVCEFEAIEYKEFKKHQKKHEPKEDNQTRLGYGCQMCEYVTMDCSNFRRHLLTHQPKEERVGRKKYSCSSCSYETFDGSNFHRHKKVHKPKHLLVPNKKHVCGVCDYQTEDLSNFNRHLIIHQRQRDGSKSANGKRKRFACDLCRYRATSLRHLRKHLLSHELKCESLRMDFNDGGDSVKTEWGDESHFDPAVSGRRRRRQTDGTIEQNYVDSDPVEYKVKQEPVTNEDATLNDTRFEF